MMHKSLLDVWFRAEPACAQEKKLLPAWSEILRTLMLLLLLTLPTSAPVHAQQTWSQKLGWPSDKRVLILSGAQMGMCWETNEAGRKLLADGACGSVDLMVPCPWFDDFAQWYRQHPQHDVGLCLTLNSDGRSYRWRPVSPTDQVTSLVDGDGFFPRTVMQISATADAQQVQRELEAQLSAFRAAGIRPTHLSPYLGTLFSRADLLEVYLGMAKRQWIPAVVIELTPRHLQMFRERGVPLDTATIELVANYPLPKLDDLRFVPEGETYEAKRDAFRELIKSLPPGLTQIVSFPAEESGALKAIAPSWQQRVWDAQLLADPEVQKELHADGVLLTNWRQVMQRFEGRPDEIEAGDNAQLPAPQRMRPDPSLSPANSRP